MPAKSKAQQRLLGAAYAYAKGELKDAPKIIKDVAKSFMKKGKKKGTKSLKDFAKTKHKGLPEKVTKVQERILKFSNFIKENYKFEDFTLLEKEESNNNKLISYSDK